MSDKDNYREMKNYSTGSDNMSKNQDEDLEV